MKATGYQIANNNMLNIYFINNYLSEFKGKQNHE